MASAVPEQKTNKMVELLTKEVMLFCGIPKAVLTNRGTNLLSHLMLKVGCYLTEYNSIPPRMQWYG